MGLFKDFQMDSKRESEGIEVQYSINADKSIPTFRIARASNTNPRYTKSLERITRPHRRKIEMETLKNEEADRLRIEVFIDSVLLGWNHVQDEDGKEIPFSTENARKLFTALPELFNDLEAQAKKASLFRVEEMEAEAKN